MDQDKIARSITNHLNRSLDTMSYDTTSRLAAARTAALQKQKPEVVHNGFTIALRNRLSTPVAITMLVLTLFMGVTTYNSTQLDDAIDNDVLSEYTTQFEDDNNLYDVIDENSNL